MDYRKLNAEVKGRMYDLHLKINYLPSFHNGFREQIGRDYWIEHESEEELEYFYKKINISLRKEKINKIFKKI